MDCRCDSHEHHIEVFPDDVEDFVRPLTLLRDEDGIHLYHCPTCQQLWYFDYISRSNLAVKLERAEDWHTVDAEAMREEIHIQQLLDHCGGYSDDPCKWAGCNNKAVKGRAFCPYH